MTFEDISKYLQFASDLVTAVLGVITLCAIIFKRKKLSLLFNVIFNTHLNNRIKRIRETLTSLENINIDINGKEKQKDAIALIGSLIGQIKPLCIKQVRLQEICDLLILMTEGKKQIKQHQINSSVHEIGGILDDLLILNYSDIFSEGNKK